MDLKEFTKIAVSEWRSMTRDPKHFEQKRKWYQGYKPISKAGKKAYAKHKSHNLKKTLAAAGLTAATLGAAYALS